MAELKASEQGLKQIRQARNKKGWIVEDSQWLSEASKILDPKRDWQTEDGIYASGVSSGTWKAFLYNSRGKRISTEVFKAYCQVLGIAWEEIIEQTIENPGDSLQANEANHLGDRFSKAVAQLGSSDIYVRLSGIYALEQIAKDAEEQYYWQAMEILTLYVRERSPYPPKATKKRLSSVQAAIDAVRSDTHSEEDIPPLSIDIQAVMTVLARRKHSYGHPLEQHPLDLHGADLRRLQLPPNTKLNQANLAGTNLQEANLAGTNLQEANLEEANLQKAYLWGANLQEAYLRKADLQGARLKNAKLQNAGLVGAQLQRVNFECAELAGAFLGGAELAGAFLFEADLQGADLRLAKLQGANLQEANLQGARLCRADLQNVRFDNAKLQGATLELANLYGAFGLNLKQVQESIFYESAILPDYLQPESPQVEEAQPATQATESVQAEGETAATPPEETPLAPPEEMQ